jgi:hypothetical protein
MVSTFYFQKLLRAVDKKQQLPHQVFRNQI